LIRIGDSGFSANDEAIASMPELRIVAAQVNARRRAYAYASSAVEDFVSRTSLGNPRSFIQPQVDIIMEDVSSPSPRPDVFMIEADPASAPSRRYVKTASKKRQAVVDDASAISDSIEHSIENGPIHRDYYIPELEVIDEGHIEL